MNLTKRLWIVITSLLISLVISIKVDDENTFETVHTSNAAVLNRLGLTPIETPVSHFNKRLSGPEPQKLSSSLHYSNSLSRIHQPSNRRHGHYDSHVYVVKLPASPPYYTVTKPVKPAVNPIDKYDKKKNISNKNGIENSIYGSSTIHKPSSVGFNSNGKPDKIYHWNLPLMKKINEKKRLNTLFKMDLFKKNYLKNIKNYSNNNTQTRNNDKLLNYYNEKSNHNESIKVNDFLNKIKNDNNYTRKMYRLDEDIYKLNNFHNSLLDNKKKNDNYFDTNIKEIENTKQRKIKTSMTYYAPITTEATELSLNNNNKKYFSGNGKPKAFYVMEKSRRKPIYYHSLLP
ncbi:hybrid signal transduction histidine kinase M [Cotesia glomerata]|uniref:hybrid signal transduction histidine kinase M n=1 Tax=Cotesia glomerata TaxID=32391 RepID=UPI001D00D1C3|nr:hybrid signal transduction histidine kinase M [Cotesia glomerata]